MALLFMDSFDHYATADIQEKWSQIIAVPNFPITSAINTTSGRRASGGVRWAGSSGQYGGSSFSKVLPSNGATVVVGFAFVQSFGSYTNLATNAIFNPVTYNDGNYVVAVRQGGTVQLWLRINTTGTMSVLRGSTELGVTTNVLPLGAGQYSYIEFKALIDPAVGTVEVRVNGTSWLTLTAQNTRNTASSTWTDILIGGLRLNGGNPTTWDYDDLYVLDGSGSSPWNTFLGDVRVDARVPTAVSANGAPNTGWTPSTGANWQNVDDAAPNDDTDYNAAATAGLIDTFVVQDTLTSGATIFGVQHCISAKKTDAGTAALAPVIRHSGTDNVGTDISVSSTYTYGLQVNQTNPGTGAAWTETDFNAAEFGYKRTV